MESQDLSEDPIMEVSKLQEIVEFLADLADRAMFFRLTFVFRLV